MILKAIKYFYRKSKKRKEMIIDRRLFDIDEIEATKKFLEDRLLDHKEKKSLIFSFDGPPGVGKDSQINILKKKLEKEAYKVEVFRETSIKFFGEIDTLAEEYAELRRGYIKKNWENSSPAELRRYLVMARENAWCKYIRPIAINEKKIILLNRSYVSALAIAAIDSPEKSLIAIAHDVISPSVIPADISFIINARPEIAYSRLKYRANKGKLRGKDWIDPWYKIVYEQKYGVKEKLPEMRFWWLMHNERVYNDLSSIITNGELITTNKKRLRGENVSNLMFRYIKQKADECF